MAPQGLKEKLDYEDLSQAPDDGLRYELLDGKVHVTPSPRPRHQRVSKRLQRQLERYFEEREIGEVFNAPVDVLLGEHDVVVPDLVVVLDPAQVTDRAIEGVPLLLVEILSPTTASRDRSIKSHRYAEFGVLHYWIVDPTKHTLECYHLSGPRYELAANGEGAAHLTHPDFPELVIDLSTLWR